MVCRRRAGGGVGTFASRWLMEGRVDCRAARASRLTHSVVRWWCMAVSLAWLKTVDFKDIVFQSHIKSCV